MRKNKTFFNGCWMGVLMSIVIMSVKADTAVGVFNARLQQVITSSTLKWSTATVDFVVGAQSDDGPLYLCRARQEADWLLGQVQPGSTKCTISPDKVYETYEVLENIHNSSLLYWKSWSKFLSKPTGAVVLDASANYVFIGRIKSESGYSHKIGKISYESTIGHLITFDDDGNETVKDDGEILIEIEPIGYELKNVELNQNSLHTRQDEPTIFEERVLSNNEDTAATVTTEIPFKYNYTLYWGHSHGIAIGLNTTIEMADKTELPAIEWANTYFVERKELFKLEQYLEPGTACHVTFRGNFTTRDVKYTATLVTLYKKEESQSRQIQGERVETTMEVEAIYGPVYFLANNSLVPTTTTTTTTTTSTTTTEPPPTEPPAPEENDIASPMKKADQLETPDGNDMMGDSSEGNAKASPTSEEKIMRANVRILENKSNSATGRIISASAIFIPIIALLI